MRIREAEGEGSGELMKQPLGGISVRGRVGRQHGDKAVGGTEIQPGNEVGRGDE